MLWMVKPCGCNVESRFLIMVTERSVVFHEIQHSTSIRYITSLNGFLDKYLGWQQRVCYYIEEQLAVSLYKVICLCLQELNT